jgi:hypothetical protein
MAVHKESPMRYLLGTHRASWFEPLHHRHHFGECAVGSQFSCLEYEEKVPIFSAPSPGERWRAFLPRLLCIGDAGSLNATSAYKAVAKRWASAGSKARAERWVPVGRSKTGLRLDVSRFMPPTHESPDYFRALNSPGESVAATTILVPGKKHNFKLTGVKVRRREFIASFASSTRKELRAEREASRSPWQPVHVANTASGESRCT